MKFLFDLDGTLTSKETLPVISKRFNVQSQIDELTKETIRGGIPFIESFLQRIHILKEFPVSEVRALLSTVPVYSKLLDFIQSNKSDCIIVTGNLREWVSELTAIFGCECVASEGEVVNDRLIRIDKIVRKEDVVRKYKEAGEKVVFIGDGNNDAEAMRVADISIASGLTHMPSNSVLAVCDYLVMSEKSLVRQLEQIKSEKIGVSVVLCCAGVGSRLGLGITKVLLEVHGRALIDLHLENFKEVDDLRVVVGFQALKVIERVVLFRDDVTFVFNHEYFSTKTGHSYFLGARHGLSYAVQWDGDLLVHPEDVFECISELSEYAAGSEIASDDPVYISTVGNMVSSFSREGGEHEWTGPCAMRKDNIKDTDSNVFNQLQSILPIKFRKIRAFDIDTYEDYANVSERVLEWK